MAQGRIEIEFKPKGDKALILAVKQLDVVTKRLKNTTSVYEKEVDELALAQRKLNNQLKNGNRISPLGVKNNRLLSNSFATLRSKLLLASFAVGLATMAFKKLFAATIEQERVEKKLEHQLGRVNKSLLNYASGLQKVTKFGDEAIIQVQGMLAAFTKDEEQIKLATAATLDLAEAKGMDLKAAGDIVSKTLGSSTNSVTRYGIEVVGTANSIRRLESFTRNVSTLFGGEAAAAADTFGGSIAQMSNAIGDTNEAIGKAFAPMMQDLAEIFTDIAESATEFFLTLSEDPMETTIRRIEEMGGNADELRLNFLELKKMEIAPKTEGMGNIKDIQDDINENDDYRLFILGEIGKQQERLVKNGYDISQLDKRANELLTLSMFEFDIAELNKAKARQEEAKGLLKLLNMYEGQLKTQTVYGDALKDNQKLLLEYQAIIAQIKALTGEDDPIFKLTIGDVQEFTEKWSSSVMNVVNSYNAQRQAALDAEKATALAATKGIRSERRRAKAVEKIEKEFAERQKALNKRSKRAKRTQTVINNAVAIMEVWADKEAPLWSKIIMSALVAAAGQQQLKTIDATKYAQGGYVGGRRHSQGGTMIEAERGEYVVSRRGVDAIGLEALNRINAGAGGGSVNISFSGNVLSKDFIEDEAIPQIKEAIRRGADIGIG